MRVSVIIPYTSRDLDLLPRAYNSVEKQTVQPSEILCIFDEHYQGIPWARNTGFEKATGEFILPLDCDDWIESTYLEKTLEQMKDPRVGIVSTYMMYHGENEGMIIPTCARTYESQLQENRITVTSLVRAEAIRQAGPWDHNLRGWEDWDMWLRILKLGWQHRVVPEVLFHYRLHSGGMNQWANENRWLLRKYLNEKHPGFMEIRKNGEKWNDI